VLFGERGHEIRSTVLERAARLAGIVLYEKVRESGVGTQSGRLPQRGIADRYRREKPFVDRQGDIVRVARKFPLPPAFEDAREGAVFLLCRGTGITEISSRFDRIFRPANRTGIKPPHA